MALALGIDSRKHALCTFHGILHILQYEHLQDKYYIVYRYSATKDIDITPFVVRYNSSFFIFRGKAICIDRSSWDGSESDKRGLARKNLLMEGEADGTRVCKVKRIYENRCMKAWTFFDYSTGRGLSLEILEGCNMQITDLLRPHPKQNWNAADNIINEQNLISLPSNLQS